MLISVGQPCPSHLLTLGGPCPSPALAEVTDALDIWVDSTGMLHEAECDADEAIRAALEEQEGSGQGGSGGSAASGAPNGPIEFARGASWLPLWRM